MRFVTSLSVWNNLKHDTEFSPQPAEKIHDGKNHTVRCWVQATVTESTKNPTLGILGFAISDGTKWDLQWTKSESIKNESIKNNYNSSYVNYFITNPNLTTIFSHIVWFHTILYVFCAISSCGRLSFFQMCILERAFIALSHKEVSSWWAYTENATLVHHCLFPFDSVGNC